MPVPAHPQTSMPEIVAAARRLLEVRGVNALTMRDIADEVGVRGPSLYKRVRNLSDVLRLVLDDVAAELAAALEAVASSGDPVEDLRRMAGAYRSLAHANPIAHALLFAPRPADGATARAELSSAALLRTTRALVGDEDALPAARTVVAWAHGFVTMEMSGAFRLGGDVGKAWDFGLARVTDALQQRRK